MSTYDAKSVQVRDRQLKVQTLKIPFTITGNATPASVVPANDEPSVLYFNTEGVDQITAALDAGEAVPTYTTPSDANGLFSVLVKVSEPLAKVCSAYMVRRSPGTGSQEIVALSLANTTGLSANGDKICLNADTSQDLAAGSLDSCLEVSYVVQE